LPSYLFAELDKARDELKSQGKKVIDLGVGDPDLPPPSMLVEKMKNELNNPAWHRYPPYEGTLEFRKEVAGFYSDRFGVSLDPENEVLGLIGSKEGIGHLSFAVLDHGDYGIIPDPGYPVYGNTVLLAGGEIFNLPLLEENNYLPDLTTIPSGILEKTKIIFLNYPNNPTGAMADLSFLEQAVDFAGKHDIILAYDNAYSEIYYDEDNRPASILQVPGAKAIAVEFNSLSKMFNVTGWRIGFAVGSPIVLKGLLKLKKNIDSGVFSAIGSAGAFALSSCRDEISKMRDIYRKRRDIMINSLNQAGLKVGPPPATFYIWGKIPGKVNSTTFCSNLLKESGVLITPGVGFGEHGEGYFRISLTCPDEDLKLGADRIIEFFKKQKKEITLPIE